MAGGEEAIIESEEDSVVEEFMRSEFLNYFRP